VRECKFELGINQLCDDMSAWWSLTESQLCNSAPSPSYINPAQPQLESLSFNGSSTELVTVFDEWGVAYSRGS